MADLTLAQMLALLPDNTTGEISAADLRSIVQALQERTDGVNAVSGLKFSTTPVVPAFTSGHVHWNATDEILEIMTGVTGVTLQLGHEAYASVRNTTGSTILNGRPVRVTGASGTRPLVSLDNGQGRVIGVMTHDIANNANGKATVYGLVRDIDTSAFVDGDDVYASAAGTLTTSPTSSFVGVVLLAHPVNGILLSSPDARITSSGTTAARPVTVSTGYMYYDTTIGKPIWWNGSSWRDATGAAA